MPIILPPDARKARKKTRTLRPTKTPRGVEKGYRESLDAINAVLKQSLEPINQLITQDVTPSRIADEIDRQSQQTQNLVDSSADILAASYVAEVSAVNKRRLENVYKSAFSVDTARIIDDENLTESLDAAIFENVSLIKTIPQDFWKDVIQAVMSNFRGVAQIGDDTLQERMRKIGNISQNRSRLIARDQTAKINSSFTRIRHQNIGVKKYIWHNAQDQRVVGNPVGLYPKGNRVHGNHWEREGKVYFYDNPPADGNPGMPIQCRCWAEPVIDLDDMDVIYSG